jgi:hypothetical protein
MLSTPPQTMADQQLAHPDPSQQVEELLRLVREQSKVIQSLQSQLSKQITNQIANSTKQLEAHHALQALIGEVAAPLHGWPISPDFALQLVRLIRDNDYHVIVEFGSGTSTLLSLRAIELFGRNLFPCDQSLRRLLTFEHLEAFHLQTNKLVSACANRSLLDLRLSPLAPWADATGNYSYYSDTTDIAELVYFLSHSVQKPLKLLVVIDGPPGATCPWARYPAVPIVLDAASGIDISIDFLLDDLNRTDEKEMALAWEKQFQRFGLPYRRVDFPFEKGGLLLCTQSLKSVDTSLVGAKMLDFEDRINKLEAESRQLEDAFKAS